jgi:hypothetical protein
MIFLEPVTAGVRGCLLDALLAKSAVLAVPRAGAEADPVSADPKPDLEQPAANRNTWSQRYSHHRLIRVAEFPAGIAPPKKVRVYTRGAKNLLSWWDCALGCSRWERVEGDLVAAIVRAREIDRRLAEARTAGVAGRTRLTHAELVAAYLEDLSRRADAGEVTPGTVERYRAALDHFLEFCEEAATSRKWPYAAGADRQFRLTLAAFLCDRPVRPNGRDGAEARPMKAIGYVMDTVRAAFAWAADPDRGRLLPDTFRNPFISTGQTRQIAPADPLARPDLNTEMAIDMIKACDRFQLRLFAPMILFGLRAAEPCVVFTADLTDSHMAVVNRPELAVRTKGRRDKRLPLAPALGRLWDLLRSGTNGGLLFTRRGVVDGTETPPLAGCSPAELATEYRARLGRLRERGSAARERVRRELFRDAGGLAYDGVEGEFRGLARQLGWSPAATLKDLRHHFVTAAIDAGMPDAHLKYLLGHAPGRAAVAAYTHLHDVGQHFGRVLAGPWAGLVAAINDRAALASA